MASEVNLLSRFTSERSAEACAESLRAHGFDIVQVDSVNPTPETDVNWLSPVVEWGRYGYQPDLVDDKWIQTSSNGLGLNEPTWLVTAVVEDPDAPVAREIIRQHGGSV